MDEKILYLDKIKEEKGLVEITLEEVMLRVIKRQVKTYIEELKTIDGVNNDLDILPDNSNSVTIDEIAECRFRSALTYNMVSAAMDSFAEAIEILTGRRELSFDAEKIKLEIKSKDFMQKFKECIEKEREEI